MTTCNTTNFTYLRHLRIARRWQYVDDDRAVSGQRVQSDPRRCGRSADARRMVRRNRRHGMVLFQADEWRARLAEKRADLPANHEVFRWRLQRPQRIIDTPCQGPPRSIFYLLSKSSWPIVGFLISVPCGDIVRLLNVLMRERPAFGGCRHDQERRAPMLRNSPREPLGFTHSYQVSQSSSETRNMRMSL